MTGLGGAPSIARTGSGRIGDGPRRESTGNRNA